MRPPGGGEPSLSGSAGRAHRRAARCGDGGLTTLEWLLVVAAVAGLAALAVVLVQSVVGDTAERVESSDARQTAADLAATGLERRWAAETPSTPEDVKRINRAYGARCRQLGVIYSDISLSVRVHEGTLKHPGGGWDVTPACNLV